MYQLIPQIRFKNYPISLVEEFNFLGIMFDKHLLWNKQIFNLSQKLSRAIGILNRLKHFIPKYCLKLIYNALFNSHLNYGILLWGHKAKNIEYLQKKAIRAVSSSHFLAHTDPLFKKENILKAQDIFTTRSILLFYRLQNNLLPQNIASIFDNHNVSIHRYPTSDSI